MISLKDLSEYIRNKQSVKITILASIVSIILLLILFKFSDFNRLFNSVVNVNIFYLIASFFIFILSIIVVSLRLLFVLHLSLKEKFIPSFDVSILHTILLCILPARLGDICYPFLLNKNLGIIMSHSVVNLLILRIYDFMVSVLLFLFSTVAITFDSADKLILQKAALIFFIVSICLLVTCKYLSSINIIPASYNSSNHRIKKIIEILLQIQEGFRLIKLIDHIVLFSMTFIKWLLSIAVIFTIFQALNMNIKAVESIFVTAGMNLVVALPIQTIGGFGITEAAMAFLLSLVGFVTDEAVTYSLATRIIWLLMPITIGIIWLLIRNTKLKSSKD